jgi:hypothetical protein
MRLKTVEFPVCRYARKKVSLPVCRQTEFSGKLTSQNGLYLLDLFSLPFAEGVLANSANYPVFQFAVFPPLFRVGKRQATGRQAAEWVEL